MGLHRSRTQAQPVEPGPACDGECACCRTDRELLLEDGQFPGNTHSVPDEWTTGFKGITPDLEPG